MKKLKPLPQFKSEDEEREFWDNNSPLDYMSVVAVSRDKSLFPNLKPTTKKISLRLPNSLIEAAKTEANKRDVPYQSLLKQFIFNGLYPSKTNKNL